MVERSYDPADRRPVAARGWRPIGAAAAFLVAKGASPNAISIGGMAAALVAGGLLTLAPGVSPAWPMLLATAVLIQLRLLANVLDGMVAVGRGVASPVGELYNEIPDRVSDMAVLAGLGVAAQHPALGWAAAAVAVLTAYVRAAGRAAGAPSDFRGPMAKQQRMMLATALCLFWTVAPPAWNEVAGQVVLWMIVVLSAVTAMRRLSGTAAALRR